MQGCRLMATTQHGAAPSIDQIEMTDADIEFAERIAKRLGFRQTAYTSSSALWGLYCLRDNPQEMGKHVYQGNGKGFDANCATCGGKDRDSVHTLRPNYRFDGCIIKTRQFGFLFVADLEDMQMHDLHAEAAE